MTDSHEEPQGWFNRLRQGLSASSTKIASSLTGLLTERRLDDQTIEQLEDILISSDLGVEAASFLTAQLAEKKFDKNITNEEVRISFSENIEKILDPVAKPINIDKSLKPHVILVCGVNGSGKTTTIGKLAQQWKQDGKTVCLAAADTFRAAAIEQLEVWGKRTGSLVITQSQGSDPASVAYDAIQKSQESQADILIIDTAGRLQNRTELMDELAKVIRVIKKKIPEAPHDCLLILDGTVGQNAHSQVANFQNMVEVTGLIVTKLDGSAKGGVVVALAKKFGLPIHAVGVGESADDLKPFDPGYFSKSLMGLN